MTDQVNERRGRPKEATTGGWSDSRSSRPWGPGSSRASGGMARGGSRTWSLRPRTCSMILGSGSGTSPKRSRSCPNVSGALKSPPKIRGSSPVQASACSAARTASRPALGESQEVRCTLATANAAPSGARSRAQSSRRRSGRRVRVSRRLSTIRQGGRTSSWFEPPSQDPIKSGLRSASHRRRGAPALRAVSAEAAPRAPDPRARARSQCGGASCRSATSHSYRASMAPNSILSGRLTCACVASASVTRKTRERHVTRRGLGGSSRPWKMFHDRTRTAMPAVNS
jgi:hypothetical protein